MESPDYTATDDGQRRPRSRVTGVEDVFLCEMLKQTLAPRGNDCEAIGGWAGENERAASPNHLFEHLAR
jgi:hypothetical protein